MLFDVAIAAMSPQHKEHEEVEEGGDVSRGEDVSVLDTEVITDFAEVVKQIQILLLSHTHNAAATVTGRVREQQHKIALLEAEVAHLKELLCLSTAHQLQMSCLREEKIRSEAALREQRFVTEAAALREQHLQILALQQSKLEQENQHLRLEAVSREHLLQKDAQVLLLQAALRKCESSEQRDREQQSKAPTEMRQESDDGVALDAEDSLNETIERDAAEAAEWLTKRLA